MRRGTNFDTHQICAPPHSIQGGKGGEALLLPSPLPARLRVGNDWCLRYFGNATVSPSVNESCLINSQEIDDKKQ